MTHTRCKLNFNQIRVSNLCTCSSASKGPYGGTYLHGFEFSTSSHIFLDLFQNLTDIFLSMVGDILVDCKTPVMTSSVLRSVGSVSWRCSCIGVKLCACINRDDYVCMSVFDCTVIKKKNLCTYRGIEPSHN